MRERVRDRRVVLLVPTMWCRETACCTEVANMFSQTTLREAHLGQGASVCGIGHGRIWGWELA